MRQELRSVASIGRVAVRIWCLAVPLLGLASCGDGSAATELALPLGPPIRVQIAEVPAGPGENPIEVSVDGSLQVYSLPHDPVLLAEIPRSRVPIRVDGESILVADQRFGRQVRVRSSRGTPLRVRTHLDSSDGLKYRGVLDLFNYGTMLRLINELSLEEYLAGVVGREMGGSRFSLEALKAQAITARTYTLYNLKTVLDIRGTLPPDEPFKATMEFQVYDGMDGENARVIQAIRDTGGQVLTFRSMLFKAYYHSTCGGHTASGRLFGERDIEPLRGVPCPHCRTAPQFRWNETLPLQELQTALRSWALVHEVEMGELRGLRPVERLESEHGLYVAVEHSGGGFEIRGDRFRELIRRHFGKAVLSSRFTASLDRAGGVVAFQGRGFGHGVGLCQNGAAELARNWTSGRILEYYFPGSGLKKVY